MKRVFLVAGILAALGFVAWATMPSPSFAGSSSYWDCTVTAIYDDGMGETGNVRVCEDTKDTAAFVAITKFCRDSLRGFEACVRGSSYSCSNTGIPCQR